MNRKTKKPKIMLPRKFVPLSESVVDSDSNTSTHKYGNETLPFSSTMFEGKTSSARKLKRVLAEEISEIGTTNESHSNHQITTNVHKSENKENLVAAEAKKCESFEAHKTGCPKCSGSSVDPDESGESELKDTSSDVEETCNPSTEGSEDESSLQEMSSADNTSVQPFCSSFNSDLSKIPRHARFPSESNMSTISELDQTTRLRVSDVSESHSSKQAQNRVGGKLVRKKGFDVIKLNDSGSKCEYQFVDGVHQRFCSSYLGNGFNVPSQIRFSCDPSLSAITSNVSDTTLTELNDNEYGDDGPFCSSFRQDISKIPSSMTFSLQETLSDSTSQRYNLRKRKVIVPIQEESEGEDSTLKPVSIIESKSESENDSQSSEDEDEIANCAWLTEHKLTCSICDTGGNAESLILDATSAESEAPTTGASKRFKCGQCEKSFGQKRYLRTHSESVHQGLKPYSCSTCNKSFSQIGNLQKHQKTIHEGKRDHICSTCGAAFQQKSHLKTHQKLVHEGKRDHICSTCGATFQLKADLQRHQKTVHEGKKEYICPTCGIAFGHKSTLLCHERVTHQGRKDHVCTTCGKAFGRKGDLTGHMLTHGTKRLFACDSCDLKFKYGRSLRRHKRNAHETNSQTEV